MNGLKQNPVQEAQDTGRQLGQQIVVLDRGWVYVGQVTVTGDLVTISKARNIRRWGTSNGLGELATNGPRPNTQLDGAGTVIAPMSSVVHFIQCAKEW